MIIIEYVVRKDLTEKRGIWNMNNKQQLQDLLNECKFDMAKLKAELKEAKKIGYYDDIEEIRDNIATLKEQITYIEKELRNL